MITRRLVRLNRFLTFAVAIALTLVGVIGTGGCARTKASHDIKAAPVGSLVVGWELPLQFDRDNDSLRGIYLRDDVLFVYTQRNRVFGINATSGKMIFSASVDPGGTPLKPPLVIKDKFAFPTSSTVEIYDRAGQHLDSMDPKRSIRSPGAVSVATNTIYVGLDYPNGGRLAALDMSSHFHRQRFEYMTFGGISAAPVVHQGAVYCGSEDTRVYATTEEGKPIWPLDKYSFKTDGPVTADLRADDNGVYVASTDSKLYCLDLASGKIRWQFYSGAPLTDAPILTPTTVYQIVPSTGVAAIDKTTGEYNRKPKWIAKGATRYLAEDDANVYVLHSDGSIQALDKATGAIKFKSRRDDLLGYAINPSVKSPMIYASTRNGLVLGIKPITKPGTVGRMLSNTGSDGRSYEGGRGHELDPRR